MDPELKEAAKKGDINFLIKAISLHPSSSNNDYFVTQLSRAHGNHSTGNIFHIAGWKDRVEFISEAIQRLPNDILNQLLFEKDEDDWTPLHVAGIRGEFSHDIVKLILDYYKSIPTDEKPATKPWLALTNTNSTPLHVLLDCDSDDPDDDEDGAMELLLMDVELLSNMVDEDGKSPLFFAMRYGYNQVAEKILTSCPLSSISISGNDGLTPLHFAPNCSENVFKLLLKNFGECFDKIDDRGYSTLHQWAEIGEAWPCKLLLETSDFAEAKTKIFKDLVCLKENEAGDTPLHISVKKKESELSQILVQGYQQVMSEYQDLVSDSECTPWKVKNISGYTPLTTAIYEASRRELAKFCI